MGAKRNHFYEDKPVKTPFTILALLWASGPASAALVERLGGKAIYDPVAHLTWMQDANYAKTSGYDVDGLMTRDEAMIWAASLNIDGVAGWRLPGGPILDFGYNQTTDEMGNLFYNVLGGRAGGNIADTHNANYGLFKNIQSFPNSDRGTAWYWSSIDPVVGGGGAWAFNFNGGWQGGTDKTDQMFAWAVRSGDVADVAPVPLPSTGYLFASAIAGARLLRRRPAKSL
jgi:hypothetical protein